MQAKLLRASDYVSIGARQNFEIENRSGAVPGKFGGAEIRGVKES
jgi:hypothetical protein